MSPRAPSPFAPDTRMLRQFAGLWLVVLGGVALVQEFALGHHRAAMVLAVLAVTLGPLGLAWPRAIRPVYLTALALAWPIGWVVSHVVLTLIYLLLFTPLALVFRLMGRDALRLKRRPDAATYWQPKPRAQDPAQYLRQY